ncbi:transposase [Apilactobacillus ozensis]|uniref:transposase n=1 Tax=Apilactobacillus ozensis TaxID=866801 RepID=UPI00200A3CA5|nr:transposase [Apilactobacillus ozensis]MCK8607074.1 transposase [Apilactobacillus ozensis]
MVLRAIKARIYPNNFQQQQVMINFGCCRFVWNQLLNIQIERYANGGSFVREFDMNLLIKALKNEYLWLKQADSTSLQQVSRDIQNAYQRFFKKQGGFPKFKSRKFPRQSYTSKCVSNNIKVIDDRHIRIPKLGVIPYHCGRQIKGKIKRATLRLSATNKFYLAILVEVDVPLFEKTNQTVGIDRNIDNLIAMSNGTIVPTIRFDKNLAYKKHQWQKKLARRRARALKEIAWDKHNHVLEPRKIKDFRNVEKARIMVAKYSEKERNQRTDYLQKLSTQIVKKFDSIAIEKLGTKNMLKNHKLARAISNQGWYALQQMLEYKCKWYGKELKLVPAKNTTQTCSACGYLLQQSEKLTLDVSDWVCSNCHTHHIRDVNSANNILNLATQ